MKRVYRFSVGIACNSCSESISNVLQSNDIQAFHIDPVAKTLLVIIEDDQYQDEDIKQKIIKWITDAGIEYCKAIENASQKANQSISLKRDYLFKGIIGLLCGITLLMAGVFAVSMSLISIYLMASVSTILTLYLGKDIYSQAVKKLFNHQMLTMDVLFTMSSLSALVVSIVALFVPCFPMMFSAPLLIFGFRYIGKVIEESAKKAVTHGLTFRERVSSEVTVMEEGKQVSRPISEIKKGDLIFVSAGQVIPLNGQCLQSSNIYETIINGSIVPRSIDKDESVFAGMETVDQPIMIQVTADEKNSYLSQLDEKLQETHQEKASIEKTANVVLRYFVPFIIFLAILSGIFIGFFFSVALGIQCFVSVLVSACPCTLGFIVPLSIQIGIAKAMEYGAQFKSGKSLQIAQKIDTVVFDLNGTLTKGTISVDQIYVSDGYSVEQVLSYFKALEKGSKHPIAKAICAYKENESIADIHVKDIRYENTGIQGVINENLYRVGNGAMMQKYGIETKNFSSGADFQTQVIYLAKEEKIIGYMTLADVLREDSKIVISELKKMGKEIHVCTGAPGEVANAYLKEFDGEITVFANCVGVDSKLNYIKKLQGQNKKVAMIGDGGNDALPMKQADLGVAFQSGEIVTQDQASVMINSHSLMPILAMFSVANKAVANITQNLVMSLAYNLIVLLMGGGVLMAVGCSLSPGIGVGLMVLQMMLVLLNAYHFKRSLPHAALEKEVSKKDHLFFDKPKNVFTNSDVEAMFSQDKIPDAFPINGTDNRFISKALF